MASEDTKPLALCGICGHAHDGRCRHRGDGFVGGMGGGLANNECGCLRFDGRSEAEIVAQEQAAMRAFGPPAMDHTAFVEPRVRVVEEPPLNAGRKVTGADFVILPTGTTQATIDAMHALARDRDALASVLRAIVDNHDHTAGARGDRHCWYCKRAASPESKHADRHFTDCPRMRGRRLFGLAGS